MLNPNLHKHRIQLKAVARQAAVANGKGRRFQVDLETRGVLSGDELIGELAKYGFDDAPIRAQMALMTIEGFIQKKLGEGYQLDLSLATFFPKLSGALSTRDVDPETDGLYVQGAVSARAGLRKCLKDMIEPVNPLAKKFIRIHSVFDVKTQLFDDIEVGHELSVNGHDILVDPEAPDEGFWLEKRDGRRNRKPKPVQRAKIIESTHHDAKIVFVDPIPRGRYNLVVTTRCGEGKNYKLRRIGHPVTA